MSNKKSASDQVEQVKNSGSESDPKSKTVKSKGKKSKSFLRKVLVLAMLILIAYCGFKYFQIQQIKPSPTRHPELVSGSLDIETSDEFKEKVEAKKEDFVYQSLLKNQMQISDLNDQIKSLKEDLTRFKNRDKISKIIFAYVDLRQKIFSNDRNYKESLENFEMLVALDNDKLKGAIERMKPFLASFLNQKELSDEFDSLIPELILAKGGTGDDWMSKIRYNISKLVVIRRIDGKNPEEIDSIIVKVETLLQEGKYQEALTILSGLDQSYKNILVGFLVKLNASLEVQQDDQDILSYLKTLS